jgi:hypothetical protein
MLNNIKKLLLDYSTNKTIEVDEDILYESLSTAKYCAISAKQAFRIYTIRAESPNALSGKIKGFSELLNNLEKLDLIDNSQVCIYKIWTHNIKIIIFTDFEHTDILGILYLNE